MCDAESGSPKRSPVAPAPRDGKELTPLPALSLAAVVAELPDLDRHAARPTAHPAPRATHNEVQALLCVWRT